MRAKALAFSLQACISAAFALGIVAYFVSDRDNIMALWSSYQAGQPISES
jgi:hypothetical protein